MRLLVSVQDAEEAREAVAGGAEIVDAKDPAAGSLGMVSPGALVAIAEAVPPGIRLSAALGDVASLEDVAAVFGRIAVPLSYVKLGFMGLADQVVVEDLLAEAVHLARELPGRPAVIAVAYADFERAGSLPPDTFQFILPEVGADGLLVDTCFKDGPGLFDLLGSTELTGLAAALAPHELSFALGGGLGIGEVRAAWDAGAMIFGVRGAACEGGRTGRVVERRVRQLADAVRGCSAAR
jgi:hypothetical protein